MAQSCDGCGSKIFNINQALCSKTGGLVKRRHNEVRDLIGKLSECAWRKVVKESII